VPRQAPAWNGVSRDVAPMPAAVRMPPALHVHPPVIVTEEEVLAPGRIGDRELGPDEVGGAAAHELALVAQSAPRAFELHHGGEAASSISAQSLRQRLRRSGAR